MEPDRKVERWVTVYAWLVRLYPASFRKRFGAEMGQLFRDRLRDEVKEGRPVVFSAICLCAETIGQLGRQHVTGVVQTHGGLVRVGLGTLTLMLVPAAAMQFTDEVNWTSYDFAFAGAAIFGTGLAYQWGARQWCETWYRCAIGLALLSTLLLVWVNGAVGLVGSETEGFNALYNLVLAVGLAGSAFSRLRPSGMSRAMAAMASAHGAVGMVALWTGQHAGSLAEAAEIATMTGLFILLFLLAGRLFAKVPLGKSAFRA